MKRKDFSHLKIETIVEKDNYYDHEDYIAGVAPFLRGIKSTMFVQNKWRTNKVIDISVPLEDTSLLTEKFERGYHSFQIVFKETNNEQPIEKDKWITTFNNLLPAIKIAHCTIIFDINTLSKQSIVTFFETIEDSQELIDLKIALLIAVSNKTVTDNLTNFNWNHSLILKSNTLNPIHELTELIQASNTFLTEGLKNGFTIDALSKKIAFSLNPSSNHFEGISKMRAARWLWSKFMNQLNAKNQQSYALHILTDCDNNTDVFTSILGGAQTITSSKQVQLFFELETKITTTVDPWAGSIFIEKRTAEITQNVWNELKKQIF